MPVGGATFPAMSQLLITGLIAIGVNLAGMMIIHAVIGHFLVGFAWKRRGAAAALVLILVAQFFWIAPALLIANPQDTPDNPAAYALWFGNWIVTAFVIVLLSRTANAVPPQLSDAARLDGLSGFATWRHVTFPYFARDLGIVALLTVMATLLPYWACLTLPEAGNSIVIFQRLLSASGRLALMAIVSFAGALPLLALFFAAKRSS
jgi:ABC-type glycerol-3-phosphate transport system permease component